MTIETGYPRDVDENGALIEGSPKDRIAVLLEAVEEDIADPGNEERLNKAGLIIIEKARSTAEKATGLVSAADLQDIDSARGKIDNLRARVRAAQEGSEPRAA